MVLTAAAIPATIPPPPVGTRTTRGPAGRGGEEMLPLPVVVAEALPQPLLLLPLPLLLPLLPVPLVCSCSWICCSCSQISTPMVPCPPITCLSLYGEMKTHPVSFACAIAAFSLATQSSASTMRSGAFLARKAASFVGATERGKKISADAISEEAPGTACSA
jgi:hypothetical protein